MIKVTRRVHALTWIVFIVALSMAVATFGSLTYAQQMGHSPGEGSDEQHLATITFVSGTVGVWHEGAAKWTMVETPYELYMGDHVRTGADARAVIVFTDESELLMHEQTTVQITPREPVEAPRGVAARVKVSLGKIFNRVTPGQSDLEFETPDAVAAVRGTQFLVTTGPDGQTQLVVLAGMVDAMLDRTLTDEEMVDFLGGYLDLEGATDADALEAWLHALMDDLIAEVEESTRGTSEDIRERIAPPRDDGEAARAQALEDREQERRDELRQRDRERQQQRREELLQRLQQRQQERAEEQQQQRAEEQQRRREERQHMRDRIEQRAGDRTEERTAAETQSPDTELPPGDVPDEGGVGDHLTRVDFAEIVARLMEVEGVREDGTSPALDWATEFIERQVDSGAADEFGSNSPGPWTFEELAQLVADLGLDAETVVQVLSGQVDVFNELGLIAVGAGQRTQVAADEAPAEAAEMSDEELMAATEWVEELDDQREAAAAITDGSDDEEEEDGDDPDGEQGLGFVPGVLMPESQTGSVTGRVVRDGSPEPGHVVMLIAWDETIDIKGDPPTFVDVAETDEDGRFTFETRAGKYVVGLAPSIVGATAVPADPDGWEVGDDVPEWREQPVPRNIGDVLTWVSSPLHVGTDGYALNDFELTVGYDITFLLSLDESSNTDDGTPYALPFDGGDDAGPFVIPLRDHVDSSNPLIVQWIFDDGAVGHGYLADATVVDVELYDVSLMKDLSPMELDFDGTQVRLTDLPEAPFRLVIAVEFDDGEQLVLFGPQIVHASVLWPYVEAIHPPRVVRGNGTNNLEFEMHGWDLWGLTDVLFRLHENSDAGDWIREYITVGSAGTIANVSVPWSELWWLSGDELWTGLHEVGLYMDEELLNPNGGLSLLITSTDLSGHRSDVTLERGDLHRSARGEGPIAEAEELQAEYWQQLGQGDNGWRSEPSFLGDFMVVFDSHEWSIHALSLTDGNVFSHPVGESSLFTLASSPAQESFLYYDSGEALVSATPSNPSEQVAHGVAEEGYYDDALVHDGVLVTVSGNKLVTYDARAPWATFRQTDLPVDEYPDYRLAISTDAVLNDVPLVHAVSGPHIWTGELYTLQERWRFTTADSIVDFAVSPDGAVFYVVESTSTADRLRVRAYDARAPYGGELWSKDVQTELPAGSFQLMSNSLAVHRDGRLFTLAAIYPANTSQYAIYGLVFSADLQSVVSIEGPKLPEGNEMLRGGLVLSDNTGHAYGFVAPDRSESMLFRFVADPDVLAESPEEAWETLEFSEIDSNVAALSVARESIWVVDEWGAIYRISASGFTVMSLPPDPPLVKRADKANAQIGDVITYTITFDNTRLVDDETELVDHTNVWIQDVLPPGFVFVEGSSYVYPPGGAAPVALAPADSPKGRTGRTLQFELTDIDVGGTIPANTTRTLTYQAIVGPRVVEGATYSNTAIGYFDGNGTGVLEPDNLCAAAAPEDPVQDLPGTLPSDCDVILTNVARADVRVRPGVFTMRSLVVGKVFYDYDGDGMQSPGEPGISGARIVMETGVSVVTDPFGKFSLSNLTPGLHVFMLDETSLPGSESSVTDILGGNHRLIDLAGGGLFTVNFAVQAQLPEDESAAEAE